MADSIKIMFGKRESMSSQTFLKNEFISDGYEVEELIDGVLLVKNFLSEEDALDLSNIINNASEDDWKKEYTANLTVFCMEKFGRSDVDNLVAEGKFEITKGWEDKNLSILGTPLVNRINSRLMNKVFVADKNLSIGFGVIQRQQEGIPLAPHTDQHTDPSIKYAAVIYVNDSYTDGELYFKKKDFYIKPEARSLVIFPGNDEYEHGVNPPGPGPIRYVIPGFIKIKDFYKNNKY